MEAKISKWKNSYENNFGYLSIFILYRIIRNFKYVVIFTSLETTIQTVQGNA